MEIVGAIVGSVLTCMCGCICEPVTKQYKYIKKSTRGFGMLLERKGVLVARMEDVKLRLHIAEVKGKTCTSQVENWLLRVNDFKVRVEGLEQKARLAKRCLNGVLLDCKSRLNFGKEITRLIIEANLLDRDGQFSEERLAIFVPTMGIEMLPPRLIGKTTAEKNLEMVWECLMGDEVSKIGVYGMGGVGKTTMMKSVNDRLLKEKHCFDKVLWVTVSGDSNIHKLQHDIANVVDTDLSAEKDDARRASLLLRALRNRGRIVFILDDMWKAFSLQEIGIPEPLKDFGCKLVLTSRSLEVCHRMQCQKHIKVEPLSEDEAWELFIETVGVDIVPEVVKVAKAIVEECACLPLALVTIGGAMRGKDDIREWRIALNDLKETTSLNVDMEEQVIERLKFSYNELKDDILKQCFLYCALYPEDFKIDSRELIDHWVMEGLIKGRNMEDERDRGYVVLNKLKRCGMLESVHNASYPSKDFVLMHDLIRVMALHIARTKFMVNAGPQLKALLNEEEWREDLQRVSFTGSCVEEISISPKCPQLTTLLLIRSPLLSNGLKHIAHCFFVHMQGLRVLDIRETDVQFLPDSVSDLVKLRALLLRGCSKLKGLPSLSKVQSLEVLELEATALEELPPGMEMLVNLKRLNLSMMEKLREVIPKGLISKLSSLQELNFYGTQVDRIYAPGTEKDFVEELLCLTRLENIFINFRDLSDYNSYVGSRKFNGLKEFYIVAGNSRFFWGSHSRSVKMCNCHSIPSCTVSLPQETQFISIEEFHDLTSLSGFVCLKDLRDLRECHIYNCKIMECISSSKEEEVGTLLLESLEMMEISNCPKLSTIYKGIATASGTLFCLKELNIYGCGSLKILFSSKFLLQLQNLETLIVRNCDEMEELITVADEKQEDEIDEEGSCSSRLRELTLYGLPNLKSTWTRVFMFSNSLRYVSVGSCAGLKTLFSTRLLRHLQNLEEIEVSNCEEMEEIFIAEHETDKASESVITIRLPSLQKLQLAELSKLKIIWKGVMVCDSLETVKVLECVELRRLPKFNSDDPSQPAFQQIKGSREWWDSLEWERPYVKDLLQPFFKEEQYDWSD